MKKKAFRLTTRRSKRARNLSPAPDPVQCTKTPPVAADAPLYKADKEPSQNAAYLEAKIISCGTPDSCGSEALPTPPAKECAELGHSDDSSSDRTICAPSMPVENV